jgi:pantoate--beta-alanine ligase
MRTAHSVADVRDALSAARRDGARIGLVPTMGALHEGHLALVREARRDCDVVVVSLFVNPAQFGPGEDLEAYPRDEAADAELLEGEGVDVLFAPSAEEVYPPGFATSVEVSGLTEVMEGDPAHRGAGHFRGVTTVVAKLLNAVGPQVAYFGQKDAQQAVVIRRMARDLDFPVEIEVLPTVREPDGLALSSRNRYLDHSERARAAGLHRALERAHDAAVAGAPVAEVLDAARAQLASDGISPEYLEARDAEDLSPVQSFNGRPILIALAARIGSARLIDNLVIQGRKET